MHFWNLQNFILHKKVAFLSTRSARGSKGGVRFEKKYYFYNENSAGGLDFFFNHFFHSENLFSRACEILFKKWPCTSVTPSPSHIYKHFSKNFVPSVSKRSKANFPTLRHTKNHFEPTKNRLELSLLHQKIHFVEPKLLLRKIDMRLISQKCSKTRF